MSYALLRTANFKQNFEKENSLKSLTCNGQ